MSNRLRAPWLPAAIAMSLLAGCAAQMQPVADFGASANHLAGAYKPFTTGLEDSCEQQQRTVALSAPGNYDDEVVWRDARAFCAQYKRAGAEAAAIADGLSAYAVALVRLSGARPTVFDSEIRQASGELGAMTHDGEPVIANQELNVATKALRATALLVVEGRLQTLTKSTLQENQAPLEVVVNAMKRYADKIYDHQLTDTRAVLIGEHASFVAASNAATSSDVPRVLPWRLAQPGLRADIDANRLAHDHVLAFDEAADALVKAHADLAANFDTLHGVLQLKQVQDFVAKVQALKASAAL
ncbi:hypothetical protein [Scleromatobacter humisilvae]|uniref:Imelysin-like domain-containing protein n=1 Tax=Scleromatobacter humisilvae TaxID=2897159 RepID=A0A9X2C1R1_9BURK|nr:hypothetical protein [Scleromatobacter humisilvae]MCK9685265.1 hypothetical protein [Scleromatobacter humisilvae]